MTRFLYKSIILITGAIASMLTAAGCSGPDRQSDAFKSFSDARWAYAEAVELTPVPADSTAADTTVTGSLLVSVRHTHGYRYSNIWLEVSRPLNDSVTARDTINLSLADDFGHWRGPGSGASHLITDTLYRGLTLRRGETVRLRHIMREDTLDEVEQAGLIFIF